MPPSAMAIDQFRPRLVHQFDFEEKKLGNLESLPMHWKRVPGKGFPRYTTIGFDQKVFHSKTNSLKLQLNGGSAAIVLETGRLAVVPHAHYLLAAMVRTRDVLHTRARIAAIYVDQLGKPLTSTRRSSNLTISNGRWTPISVDMRIAPPSAAWLVIRLELVQPDQFKTRRLGPHELIKQDIKAAAWFDDVSIYQLPQIDLHTQSLTNIIRQPQKPRLSASISDLVGDNLSAVIRVYDHAGNLIVSQKRPLNRLNARAWHWTPPLKKLGWYWAELAVYSGKQRIGASKTAMLYMPPTQQRGLNEARKFSVIAENLPFKHRTFVPEIMRALPGQSMTLSLWYDDMTRQELLDSTDAANPLVRKLLAQKTDLTLSLSQVPLSLAKEAGIDTNQPLALLAGSPTKWQFYLEAIMARYGHRINHWQLGRHDSVEAFSRNDLDSLLPRVNTFVSRFTTNPRVVLPWSASHELPASAQATSALLLKIPSSIRPSQLVDYSKSLKLKPSTRVSYHLQALSPRSYSHIDRATDLALRMIRIWNNDASPMAITRPWSQLEEHTYQILPDPLLGVWANVAQQLAGRRFFAKIDLGPGIAGFLLDGPSGGVMVAWNESSPTGLATLDLYLGDQPVAVDIWGNKTPLKKNKGKQELILTQTPMFIEGINLPLARFRARFKITPPFIESTHALHPHSLHLSNPWPRTITGKLRITGPKRWTVLPRIINFSIPAGQTKQFPIEIAFPVDELAGPKRITARFELDADRLYKLDLGTPVTIGLKGVTFNATLNLQSVPNQEQMDIVITTVVKNTSNENRSFYAFMMPRGVTQQTRIISPLRPGQTVIKRFRLPNLSKKLSGIPIRVGLRETNGPANLNQRLVVP